MKLDIVSLLKRPEVITLAVAVLVAAAVALGLPTRAGLEIPQDALAKIVGLSLAVFIGAVFEGKYRGADYAGGLAQLLRSTKFRLLLVGIGTSIAGSLAGSAGIELPEGALDSLLNFLLLAVLGVGGLDGFRASQAR